jgi:hypothetical protein
MCIEGTGSEVTLAATLRSMNFIIFVECILQKSAIVLPSIQILQALHDYLFLNDMLCSTFKKPILKCFNFPVQRRRICVGFYGKICISLWLMSRFSTFHSHLAQ